MSSKFSRFLAWIEHLLHLDKHGLLPDPPSVTGAPVVVPVLPPVATPPVAAPVAPPVADPVPVSPPASAPSPVPNSGIGNGYDANGRKLNPNGSVSYKKIDDLAKAGVWPVDTAEAFVSQTVFKDGTVLTDAQKLFITFNTSNASEHLVAGQEYHLDGRGLFSAYEVTPNPLGNGTQGALVPRTMAFPCDNVINGKVEFKGFEDSDLDTFIANCNTQRAASLARHESQDIADGYLPIIRHASGPVAQ